MRPIWLLIITVLLCSGALIDYARGQEAAKVAVEVIEIGNDIVGQRLAYQVKEKIRASHSLRMTHSSELRLQLRLSTLAMPSLDPDTPVETYASVYSYVLTLGGLSDIEYPAYIESGVSYCGKERVAEASEWLVAKLDGYTAYFQEAGTSESTK